MPDVHPPTSLPAAILLAVLPVFAAPATAQTDNAALYQRNCAGCHGPERQGTGLGPPLSLASYRYGGTRADIVRVIGNGIASQGMPAFGATLSAGEITALAGLLPARDGDRAPEADEDTDEEAAEEDAPPREFDAVPGVHDTLDYALRVELFADGLETVWSMAFLDADTVLVSERTGRLRVVRRGVLQPQPVTGVPPVYVHDHRWNQAGLFDIALDPDYARNGWIYLSYAHPLEATGPEGGRLAMTRVVRGRLRGNAWVDQETVYEADHAHYGEPFWHFGGRMAFDPQGHLYVSVGDRGVQEFSREPGRPSGKIHRLRPGAGAAPDNPFAGQADALATVYSLGHRNPQGMAFEPGTGRLWATEHGPRGGDEFNIVRRGGDYGWPVVSHGINYDGTVLTPDRRADGVEQPAWFWRPSIGVSGLAFYHGAQFPLWRGKALVTALAPRQLRLLTLDGERVQHEEVVLTTQGRPYEPVVGPDGAIYIVTDDPGQILRLTAQQERPQ
ncbi:PQQ-dependent sugar dehydrogenase [Luteimonas kalidii]|uniref:PQQ-dependent sugar dehydrogenase n=1 Tax=Luteimonas kalidii TaxID=3042025 RepID=A0ABT6JU51_9GAMM|nr:PQQ-dependent sugar dehydrogenase [Luteimonas kalidii]MDH5833481.1 PQQ-dependent sugar dehydrogenase [Luteimonas kalidii]